MNARRFSCIVLISGCFATGLHAASTRPHLDGSGANLQPNYPASALPAHEQGAVVVNAEVNETGRVRRLLLLQSTGFDDLDRAGIEAVLGWRFVPALENGKPVVGWAKEKLMFVPPDAAGESTSQSVSSASAYLPSEVSVVGAYGEFARQTKTIPCATGTITAKVKMLREKASYDDPARVGLEVSSGAERAEISIVANDPVYPPMQGLGTRLEKSGKRVSGEGFDGLALLGSDVALSLTWNQSDSITADTHGFGTHVIRVSPPPTSFGLFAMSASARFSNAQLTCWGSDATPE